MITEELLRHASGLYYRDNSWDINVFREVSSGYKLINILPDAKVFDIGAHIGVFTQFALDKGAAKVIAFEPEPNNFEVLYLNFGNDPQVELHEAAVVNHDLDHGTVEFYPSNGMNTTGTLREKRGRGRIQVQAITWQEVLELEPSVIKMDIEGGEWFLPFIFPDSVVSLAIEFHHDSNSRRNNLLQTKLGALQEEGFNVVKSPITTDKAWTSIGIFSR